jgi:hypothetical protein
MQLRFDPSMAQERIAEGETGYLQIRNGKTEFRKRSLPVVPNRSSGRGWRNPRVIASSRVRIA